jgi:hypothetical protein
MSMLSKTFHALLPALAIAVPAAQRPSSELSQVLDEFREKRAEDFAQLADRAGRSGVRLAQAEAEIARWRAYAQSLECACMRHGIEMPSAPDET